MNSISLLRCILCIGLIAFARRSAASPVSELPAGARAVSACVPGMGTHWANPRNLPFGPLYGVANDRVIFTEIMVDQKAFAQGKSWTNQLRPIAGHAIDHVDIEYRPNGHPHYAIPHYDIHAYYVSHTVHEALCRHAAPTA